MLLAARATAHANIALAKYWGKIDGGGNLPAVPSVSVTLDALTTSATVVFDSRLAGDELWLGGERQSGRALERVRGLLDRVRARACVEAPARVDTSNSFPTASGLASSASAFAALALAATCAAGQPLDRREASDLARRSSVSAARSVFGGFVRLAAGKPCDRFLSAEQIALPAHWDLRVVIAVNSRRPKAVSSTLGMRVTAASSPFYGSWVAWCPTLAERIEAAIEARDLAALGDAAEHSAMAMHATAMAASPSILYFEPATLACVAAVRGLRDAGVPVYATIDAGPHVKAITTAGYVSRVQETLAGISGVVETMVSKLGGDATVEPLVWDG